MALAMAEQFPGVQECWGAAQSPVDIGSGFLWNKMGCGNKEELNLPPSVCSDQKGVQWPEGCAGDCQHTEITGSLAVVGQAAVDQLSKDELLMFLHKETAPLALQCSGDMGLPCPGGFPVPRTDILAGVLAGAVWFWGFNPSKCSQFCWRLIY